MNPPVTGDLTNLNGEAEGAFGTSGRMVAREALLES